VKEDHGGYGSMTHPNRFLALLILIIELITSCCLLF